MNKNKLLSLLLCLVLLCSFMFTACDNTNTETASEPPVETETESVSAEPEVVEKPAVIDITALYYFGDATDNASQKLAFKNYITRQYGITFNINTPARDSYIETINLQAVSGDLTGIVSMFSGTDGIRWYQEGIILAIDEYLVGNETWETIIPENWKETFSYDGKVFGLAHGGDGTPSWFTRTMRGDWLDAVNMAKPATIEEFYAAVYAFTYNDPDANGVADTWGFCSKNIWLMQDIFKAYGCTPNWEADLVPTWDANADEWMDPVIKPVMAEACTFLQKCYTEGLVHPELFSMSSTNVRNLMSNGQAGSCFYWDTWLISWEDAVKKISTSAYMVSIGALTGKVTQKVNCWKTEIGAPYVLMANTAQPKEVINWFITLTYGTASDFFTFRYGIPQADITGDVGYYLDGSKVYILYYQLADDGTVKGTVGGPLLSGGHPGYALDIGTYGYTSAYNSGNAEWDAQQVNVAAANLTRRYDVFNEYNDGRLYLLSGQFEQPTNEEYTSVIAEWAATGMTYVSSVMVDGISTDEALRTYINAVMAFSPQITLDFMNAQLGKASSQNYAALWASMN